MALSGFILKLC